MQIMYAASTNAFYIENVSKEIPSDAKPITDEIHQEMINGPANKMAMVPGKNGMPKLITRPAPERSDVSSARRNAYADPLTGSDRYFAEGNRLEAQGMPAEAAAARAAGLTRYEEIKSKHPWPNNEELDDETITRNQE